MKKMARWLNWMVSYQENDASVECIFTDYQISRPHTHSHTSIRARTLNTILDTNFIYLKYTHDQITWFEEKRVGVNENHIICILSMFWFIFFSSSSFKFYNVCVVFFSSFVQISMGAINLCHSPETIYTLYWIQTQLVNDICTHRVRARERLDENITVFKLT